MIPYKTHHTRITEIINSYIDNIETSEDIAFDIMAEIEKWERESQ
jgi:hypothetical protein